jgi:hypothetical protein
MAIDILQRYYSVELIWMKYIGTSPVLAVAYYSTANIVVRSFDAAPVYAGLAIYLTWEDHGCPDLWHYKELLKCTVLPMFIDLDGATDYDSALQSGNIDSSLGDPATAIR